MPPKTRGSRRRRGAELARNVVDAENISPEEALSQAQTSAEALNPEQLQIILSALDDEVERRCKRLKTEANELALAIRSAVNVEIMKLPKCVRGLSVAQFKETYGKDVSAVVRSSVNGATGDVRKKFSNSSSSSNAQPEGAKTPGIRRSSRSSAVAMTPRSAGNSGVPATPMTASRRPRRGEVILSANGSPLGEVNHARMATGKPDGLNLTVAMPEGEFVNLATLGKNSDAQSNADKLTTLQNLQDQINRMMAELNG